MKKLLIVNNNMHIGGVQRSLVSLLWNIRGQYDVTLLLFSPSGDCLSELPPETKLLTIGSAYRYLGMTKYDVKTISDKIGRAFWAGLFRLLGRKRVMPLMSLTQKKLTGYDIAISYLHDAAETLFYGGCNHFVLNQTDASRKIAFLHCDYVACGANTPQNAVLYAKFDGIAACSQGCADRFLSVNSQLLHKVRVVTNFHRFDKIRTEADASPITFPDGKIHIVTVARLGKEKSVDRAVKAIAQLGDLAKQMHYYIVGDGIERDNILRDIERYGLAETVSLCGELSNPYGYLRAADLLLIPSYSEAAPLVIDEAVSLGTPVLSTETSSAREMITDRGLGWVCDNSVNGIAEGLRCLLTNPDEISKWREAVLAYPSDNTKAMAQFRSLIDESSMHVLSL